MVEHLARLAGDGRALELGVGTGRIAIPLVRRGVSVHGIDRSEREIARLRAKPDGDRVESTIGDMTSTRVPGAFRLVYLVYNTIMNVTSQAGQVACFRNASRHLEAGGRFVIETMIPDLRRLPPGEVLRPFHVSEDRWGFDEYNVVDQILVSHHYRIVDGRAEASSGPFRYVWPAELDLMAQLAGLDLEGRWGGWRQEPFTADSRSHVSVWARPHD